MIKIQALAGPEGVTETAHRGTSDSKLESGTNQQIKPSVKILVDTWSEDENVGMCRFL